MNTDDSQIGGNIYLWPYKREKVHWGEPKVSKSTRMQLLQLANFVVDNLLQSRIGFIVFFHCWQGDESGRRF